MNRARLLELVCLCLAMQLLCQPGEAVADSQLQPASTELILTTPVIPDSITGTLRTVNETLSRDVAPADNVAVDLVQVFGQEAFEPELAEASMQMLGIQQLSDSSPRVIYAESYVSSLAEVPPDKVPQEVVNLMSALVPAAVKPWKREQFARLDDYLTANAAVLDAVVRLAEKPHYYAPMLTSENPPRLLAASVAIERRVPYLVHLLVARAMNRIADENLDGAMSDLLAGHKLALLLAHGSPFDISSGPAGKADSLVYRGEIALLQHGQLTAAQALNYRRFLEALPVIHTAARSADIGERAILRQEIEFIRAVPEDIKSFFETEGAQSTPTAKDAPPPAVKWELAFSRATEFQDRIVKALSTRDRVQQNRLFDELDADYQHWRATSQATSASFAEATELDLDAASRWIGESMAMSLFPQFRQRRAAEDRANIRRETIHVGLALVTFKARQGHYPEQLSELVPQYFQSIPANEGTTDMFLYASLPTGGVRLTSKGVNQRDDTGMSYNDDQSLILP